MAGTLTIDTLKASSGVLATQNGMTGICKAWLNYNATTQTIAGSFNVSSVVRNSTGFFTINFATAMSNANYAVSVCINDNGNAMQGGGCIAGTNYSTAPALMSTSQLQVTTGSTYGGVNWDVYTACVTVFGA